MLFTAWPSTTTCTHETSWFDCQTSSNHLRLIGGEVEQQVNIKFSDLKSLMELNVRIKDASLCLFIWTLSIRKKVCAVLCNNKRGRTDDGRHDDPIKSSPRAALYIFFSSLLSLLFFFSYIYLFFLLGVVDVSTRKPVFRDRFFFWEREREEKRERKRKNDNVRTNRYVGMRTQPRERVREDYGAVRPQTHSREDCSRRLHSDTRERKKKKRVFSTCRYKFLLGDWSDKPPIYCREASREGRSILERRVPKNVRVRHTAVYTCENKQSKARAPNNNKCERKVMAL